jgi:hypothetical protein
MVTLIKIGFLLISVLPADTVPVRRDSVGGKDMSNMDMSGMDMGHSAGSVSKDSTAPKPHKGPPMSWSQSLNLPMGRDGSGTGWNADATPMNGWMYHSHHWMYMVHGEIFPRYTSQDIFKSGTRGGSQFDAPNWIMGMAQRRVGNKGLLHFNLMMSLDVLTVGGAGYPLLFQTGESWKGIPLVDHQHPHDLFSEVSASYSLALNKHSDLFVYVGYPGEPALGPVAFMHRPSAFYDPDAPIGHHWQDATHITFGVATIGYRLGQWKWEGSLFTGREPDENRYNFDKPRFDSYSFRLSYSPSKHYSLQASGGYIKSPEALEPEINVYRATASILAGYPLTNNRSIDLSLVWGMNINQHNAADAAENGGGTGGSGGGTGTGGYSSPNHSVLLEAAYRVRSWAWYTRYEWVQKTAEELVLNHAGFSSGDIFSINALTLGLSKEFASIGPVRLALGAQTTLNRADGRLDPIYGSMPVGGELFLRIFPELMHMGHSM